MAATRTRTRFAFPSSELPPGACKAITVGRREIAVVNAGGRLYAVFNRCPHQQAPLALGRVARAPDPGPVGSLSYADDRVVLRCPWHHYEFDLDSGRCLADPQRLRLAVYEIRHEGDEVAVYV
jgi:nitrite reductase/ring-hydroxylating ferredoxin subunit